jgi:hypothetical protein
MRMSGFLTVGGLIPQDVIDRALVAFGTPGPDMNVRDMAEKIDTVTGGTVAVDLYFRLYVPTSTFFVHASATSLLRHVKADGRLANRPANPWARRSTVRLADACVGILAAAIARQDGTASDLFIAYAEPHLQRVMAPMMVATGKNMIRLFELKQMIRIIREVRDLRSYLSAQAASDPLDVREARIRAAYEAVVTSTVDPDVPAEAIQVVVDFLVEKILSEVPLQPDAD